MFAVAHHLPQFALNARRLRMCAGHNQPIGGLIAAIFTHSLDLPGAPFFSDALGFLSFQQNHELRQRVSFILLGSPHGVESSCVSHDGLGGKE